MNHTEYSEGIKKEWIITNGLGGYASSTTIGANTRKYHGLLIASMNPPVERRLLLSSLDEELIIGKDTHWLAVHQYPGVVHPRGNNYLESFVADPFPVFKYRAGSLVIRKHVMMMHGENTTIIRYDIENPGGKHGILRIFPLVNDRSIHSITRSNELHITQKTFSRGTRVMGKNASFTLCSDLRYSADEHWYYNFEYQVELSRGYQYREDNFSPGYFELEIKDVSTSCFIVAGTENGMKWDVQRVREMFRNEENRLESIVREDMKDDNLLRKLIVAGDSFIVDRRPAGSRSVIAGYHWFGDWGRDAMISLPGLTLVTGRFHDARSVLSTFAAHCRNGLIPNNFPEGAHSSPVYNTVDASLWFVHAAGRYFDHTGDMDLTESIWNTIEGIIDAYRNGTEYGIRMDSDGLIEHGGQLTWMDAKVGDLEITPRKGKACEINALWYNALNYAASTGERLNRDVSDLYELAELTKSNFVEKFWNEERNCLYDCLPGSGDSTGKDGSVRPNQVFAVSLPHGMLSRRMEKGIVDVVTEELLTPCGLRTLSPHDSRYKGYYGGDTEIRDAAYHNGTVWPWLLGPYITAYAKVCRDEAGLKERLRELLRGLEEHMEEACIGTISEIFDGDMPHCPGGCVSQAWSVAEITRCYVEDILSEE